jgi:hypothetical protein
VRRSVRHSCSGATLNATKLGALKRWLLEGYLKTMAAPYRQKKIRGWKRRMRELDRWAAEHAQLDLSRLLSVGDTSAEIWFERWPTPFPLRVRRRMVQHLAEIHDSWLAQLRAWGEPFYLGLWIFEPDFKRTQVCAAVGRMAADLRERHLGSAAPPPSLYHAHPCDLRRFAWTYDLRVDRELLSTYDQSEWPWLIEHANRVERTAEDALLYFEHEAWLGLLVDERVAQSK